MFKDFLNYSFRKLCKIPKASGAIYMWCTVNAPFYIEPGNMAKISATSISLPPICVENRRRTAPQQKFLQVTRKTDRNAAERIHHINTSVLRQNPSKARRHKQLWINYILQASEVFNSRPLISRMSLHDSGLDTANDSSQLISSGIIKSFWV